MWPYGSASSVWTCPLNSGQIWKYPEVLGIEKSVHLLLRIQFSIPKVEPIRSKNNIFIQKNTGKQISETYQNATWCLFPICIFSHQSLWNFLWMEHFCSVIILTKWDNSPFWFWCFCRFIGYSRPIGPWTPGLGKDDSSWTVRAGRCTDPVGETYLPERTSLALMPAGDRSICFMYFSLMFTWLLLPKKVSVRTSRGRSTPRTVHDQGRVAYGVKRTSKSGRDNVCRPDSYVIGRMDGPHGSAKLDGVSVTDSDVHWSTDGGGMAKVWSYLFDSLFESQTLKLEKINFQ